MPLATADHLVHTPRTLDEALQFLAERAGEGWQPLAGGTDLLVGINSGHEARRKWLSLQQLQPALSAIELEGDLVSVGGLATMTALRASPLLDRACPMLGAAAATVGAVQIQNRATVAGNIVNASPAGDTLPVWLAMDAIVELASATGVRRVPYAELMTGYRQTVRRDDELVTAVLFAPLPAGAHVQFRKVGTRAAQAISKIVMAAVDRPTIDGCHRDLRLAFGSMGPVIQRAVTVEAAAEGRPITAEVATEAAALIDLDLTPIDDVRSTARYRIQVARNLATAFLAMGTVLPRSARSDA